MCSGNHGALLDIKIFWIGWDMFKVIPLFSGSSGNATYIRYGDDEILVDAGVSCRMLANALQSIGTDLSFISALFITHEHSDHIKGLETLCKKYNIPVYINRDSLDGIEKQSLREILKPAACIKNAGEYVDVGQIHADIFKTPHDSYGSVGYRFTFSDGTSVGYATDIGYVTKGIASSLFGCDTVVFESNHDIQMLRNGPYPFYLKQRILSDKGHLSNASCASFIPNLFNNGTKKVILAHLSEHNNTPRLAYTTALDSINSVGLDPEKCKVTVAMKSII